jgi:hypothetical protein
MYERIIQFQALEFCAYTRMGYPYPLWFAVQRGNVLSALGVFGGTYIDTGGKGPYLRAQTLHGSCKSTRRSPHKDLQRLEYIFLMRVKIRTFGTILL